MTAGKKKEKDDTPDEPEVEDVSFENENAQPDEPVSEPVEVESKEASSEQSYPREEHLELSHSMYDEPPHVIAGVMEMLDPEGKKEEFTKSEIEGGIGDFKNKEIHPAEE